MQLLVRKEHNSNHPPRKCEKFSDQSGWSCLCDLHSIEGCQKSIQREKKSETEIDR